jgi:uncharacterized protein YfbU (UPF0304 family)
MTANIDRFRKDLDRLILEGNRLELAMLKELSGDGFRKQLRERIGEAEAEALLKILPNFRKSYEAWYSESLGLLRQLLPDRVANFVGFYEKPKGRKVVAYGSYVIQDYMQDLQRVDGFGKTVVDAQAAVPQFRQQLAILEATKRRFESSLFEIRQLVQADLFDSEIEVARELLKSGFLRAAGAVAGVVLEKHLHQMCDDHAVKITKKNPGISDLNDLLKANSVIDVPQWRHISLLADIRNLCDHNKQKEPTPQQVTDLIDGAEKVLKTIA